MAARMAISRLLPLPGKQEIRTFAQAISKTKTTAPVRTKRGKAYIAHQGVPQGHRSVSILRAQDSRESAVGGDELKLGLRHFNRDSRLEPGRYQAKAAILPVDVGFDLKRNPKVRRLVELFGVEGAQNPDYDVGDVTEGNRGAENSGIGREASRPDVVAENDDVTASWAVFVTGKSAAVENSCAVEAEESGTDKGRGEQLRIGAARQIHMIQPMG